MRSPTLLAALLAIIPATTAPARAEQVDVRMLNRGQAGPMVFEPDFVRLRLGDVLRFLSTHPGHNAAAMPELLPAGAAAFKGQINQELAVTFDVPGFHGIKCIPHYGMGMVMLVVVGDAPSDALPMPPNLPPDARKRLDDIVARQRSGQP